MKIKLIKSVIGTNKRVRGIVKALGFKRTNQVIEIKENPATKGMVEKIKHMLEVQK